MTTVAFDGKFMAADQLADHGWLRMRATKVHLGEFHGGARFLLGFAGVTHKGLELLRLLERQPDLRAALDTGFPHHRHDDTDTHAILACDGRAWYLSCSTWMPLCRPYHAIGSGRDFALAAMALGQTAHQAVALAISFDTGSGGDIDCIEA